MIQLIRPGIIIIMIITLMIHSLSFSLIYISFKIHQDYIIANYCVQKDEPINTCHGHCQLTNKMQNHEKQKKDNPLIQEEWMDPCFLKPVNRFLFQLSLSQVHIQKVFNKSLYSLTFINKIFHPPK